MINSKQYWEKQFNNSIKADSREEQTRFFVNLAIENIPQWINEDIQDNKMTICDAGCAEGAGTNALHEQYPFNQVVGLDFSENAVSGARHRYPDCKFEVGNIKFMSQNYDVIFSSNVLEHFYNSETLLKEVVSHTNKYCILLLPFREYYTISEHFSYFDFKSFPLQIDDHSLCYFKPMTMIGEQEKYWFGEQILIVYGKSSHLAKMDLTLNNLYNGYIEERTQLIQNYDAKISELKSEHNDIEILDYEAVKGENQELKDRNKLLELNQIHQKEEYQDKLRKITDQCIQMEQEIKELNNLNNGYADEKKELSDKVLFYQKELKNLQKKYETLSADCKSTEKSFFLYAKSQESKNYYMSEAYKYICLTQSSRIYRFSLAIKRFIMQCFRSHEKRDFLQWCWLKIIRKTGTSKILAEFDCLESSKYFINLAQKNVLPQIKSFDNTKFCMKATSSVIIFGSVPFYDVGGGQRSAQFAKTFNLLGYRVFYIYGFPCSEENIPDMFIPAVEHLSIDNITNEWFEYVVDKNSIVIFEIPYQKFEPYLDMANKIGCHTIYEHIDNWDSTLGSMFYDEEIFKRFLQKASFVTGTARMLVDKLGEYTNKECMYLPNAVNIEIFEPYKNYECPKDLIRGKNKTLIYFGSLWGEWFEWDKINYIAEKCPDCEINLIGDYSGCMERVRKAKENVHFLGLKKQTDLPAYLKYSDIALLPFRNCEIGKYVSPLKIFEYIAMNVRVLASNLDDIQGYPNVFCSDDKKDWVDAINENVEIVDSSRFISENNWFSRCEKLIDTTGMDNYEFPSISIIVLNYNNMKVIGRCIETLIAHNVRYEYEIIVVDNGSTDGSYELICEKYSDKIILLRNTRNGCSSGRNLGVDNASGKYICFLDSDQWIISNYWLDSFLQIMERDSNIGAVAWNAGWFTPGKTTGPIVDYLPNRGLDSADIWYRTDIAYLATSGFLMERTFFKSLGGFDEAYDPTCFEDTDISLKIRNAGKELAYSPYMGVMHLPHQTTQSGSAKHTKLMQKNGQYFKEKWTKINPKLLEYYY